MEDVKMRGNSPFFTHLEEVPFYKEPAEIPAEILAEVLPDVPAAEAPPEPELEQECEDLDAEFDRVADMSKEDLAQLLNEDLVADGRAPVFSAAMISAMNAAALRKSQKARKKKRK